MKTDKLVAALQDIKRLVEEALQKGGTARGARRVRAVTQAVVKSAKAAKNTLPAQILHLPDNGFFNPPKTDDEVHAKLQPTYSCDLNRVSVALLRLRERKHLRKTSKRVGKKSRVAYGW